MTGLFPKTSVTHSYCADLHSDAEVIYERCVPHFYHALCNALIINEFNILYQKVALLAQA